jgi:DNA-binding transcriptional ArsR family regulator
MSVGALQWAFKQRLAKANTKLILIALGHFADEQGETVVTLDHLAEFASSSRSTAQRELKALESAGLIERVERYRKDGGRSTGTYKLALPDWASPSTDPPGQADHPPLVRLTPQKQLKTCISKSKSTTSSSDDDAGADETVRVARARTADLFNTYNAHRGALPLAATITDARRAKLLKLAKRDDPLELMRRATLSAAANNYYLGNKSAKPERDGPPYGIDTILRHLDSLAEAYEEEPSDILGSIIETPYGEGTVTSLQPLTVFLTLPNTNHLDLYQTNVVIGDHGSAD